MRNNWRTLPALALTLAAGGCAVVGSNPDQTGTERLGVAYMLPKALLPVQLVEADGVLMLRMQPPLLVGDPAQRYLARNAANPFSEDDVTISVDTATGLLSSVSATTTDQTLDVLKESLRTGRVRRAELGASGAGTESVLFSGVYDPDGEDGTGNARAAQDNQALRIGVQAALVARLRDWSDECQAKPAAQAQSCAAATRQASAALTALQAVTVDGAGKRVDALVVIRARPLQAPPQAPAGAASAAPAAQPAPVTPAADCSVGVCHRALQPYLVELGIRGVFAHSTVIQLPNGGAPVAVALDRAPFVKTEHTLAFENGQLKSMHSKRPSSALALVKWPLDVYRALLEATATLIQLRIGANSKEVELAQSQLTTEKELLRLRKELDALHPESAPAAANATGPSRANALLAIEIGARSERSVLTLLPPAAAGSAATSPQSPPPPAGSPSLGSMLPAATRP